MLMSSSILLHLCESNRLCRLLQGYIKRACLAVAGSPVVARRLNVASESIVAAFKEAFQASPEQCLALEAPAVELALAFRHQCLCALRPFPYTSLNKIYSNTFQQCKESS